MKTLKLSLSLAFMLMVFLSSAQEKLDSYWVKTDAGTQMLFNPDNTTPDGSRAAGSLTTIFAANNSFAGNMFDVEVTGPNAINITSFDVNLDGTGSISIYYKLNSYVGSETTPGDWTLAGSVSGLTGTIDAPTPVAIGGITLEPGNTYGFYVALTDYVQNTNLIGYTNGGPTVYSDANLTLTTGIGNGFPIFGGNFVYREWNGTIYYNDTPSTPISNWAIVIGLLLMGAFVVVRYRTRLA